MRIRPCKQNTLYPVSLPCPCPCGFHIPVDIGHTTVAGKELLLLLLYGFSIAATEVVFQLTIVLYTHDKFKNKLGRQNIWEELKMEMWLSRQTSQSTATSEYSMIQRARNWLYIMWQVCACFYVIVFHRNLRPLAGRHLVFMRQLADYCSERWVC